MYAHLTMIGIMNCEFRWEFGEEQQPLQMSLSFNGIETDISKAKETEALAKPLFAAFMSLQYHCVYYIKIFEREVVRFVAYVFVPKHPVPISQLR